MLRSWWILGLSLAATTAGAVPCPAPGWLEVPIIRATLQQSADGQLYCGTRGCHFLPGRAPTETFTIVLMDGTVVSVVARSGGCRWGIPYASALLAEPGWPPEPRMNRRAPPAGLHNAAMETIQVQRPRSAATIRAPAAGDPWLGLALMVAILSAYLVAWLIAPGIALRWAVAASRRAAARRPVVAAAAPEAPPPFVPSHRLPTLRGSGPLLRRKLRPSASGAADRIRFRGRLHAIAAASAPPASA